MFSSLLSPRCFTIAAIQICKVLLLPVFKRKPDDNAHAGDEEEKKEQKENKTREDCSKRKADSDEEEKKEQKRPRLSSDSAVVSLVGAASLDTLEPFDEDVQNGDREASQALKASECPHCYCIAAIHCCFLMVADASLFHISRQ